MVLPRLFPGIGSPVGPVLGCSYVVVFDGAMVAVPTCALKGAGAVFVVVVV